MTRVIAVSLTEFEIIERFFTRDYAQRADVVAGIGDDGAVTRVAEGHELVTVVDMLVAGRHFPEDFPPAAIGHRAMAVNLSDLAAMAATPAWATLALALPQADEAWLGAFSRGFFACAERYGVALIGGDTTRGPLTASVQLAGLVPEGQALRRSGAAAGDRIYVTGFPGQAAAGLALWQDGERAVDGPAGRLLERLLEPEPRIAEGVSLRGVASAAIDVSDGLACDLARLARASGAGAALDPERLPVSRALEERCGGDHARRHVLHGGDDYELCFTVPPPQVPLLERHAAAWRCACTEIGEIVATAGLWMRCGTAIEPLDDEGYDHFG